MKFICLTLALIIYLFVGTFQNEEVVIIDERMGLNLINKPDCLNGIFIKRSMMDYKLVIMHECASLDIIGRLYNKTIHGIYIKEGDGVHSFTVREAGSYYFQVYVLSVSYDMNSISKNCLFDQSKSLLVDEIVHLKFGDSTNDFWWIDDQVGKLHHRFQDKGLCKGIDCFTQGLDQYHKNLIELRAISTQIDVHRLMRKFHYENRIKWEDSGKFRIQPTKKICLIGDSHMFGIYNSMILRYGYNSNNILYVRINNPIECVRFVNSHNYCDMHILSCFQWPTGKNINDVNTIKDLKKLMREYIIDNMKINSTKYLTLNVNPLNSGSLNCPPRDLRNPILTGELNRYLKELIPENVISLEEVVNPLWDIGIDWCHYYGPIFDAMLERIFHTDSMNMCVI